MNCLFLNLLTALVFVTTSAFAAGAGPAVDAQDWAFYGVRSNWDKDQLYRGYKVGTQVCMSCHSFKYISHRTLMEEGGFTDKEIRVLASEMEMKIDDKLMSALDDASAKEVYGKPVPDLSLMNKARSGLADYVYAVLVGYTEDPEGIYHAFKEEGIPEGAYFNEAFPGHAIAMPPPLAGPDMVEYHDGTPATVEQMAKDVVYFMQWTAEPELPKRKQLGMYILLYLVIFTFLAYLTKRAIWRDVH